MLFHIPTQKLIRFGLIALSSAIGLCLIAPILSLLAGSIGQYSNDTGTHLLQTVLPELFATSLILGAGVVLLAAVLGAGAAWLVSFYEFPLRRTLAWLLVLPLAMPAYIAAYAYTDFFQFSGGLQSSLRKLLGETFRLPEIRSTLGATIVFAAVLYPYIYLLVRAAFASQGAVWVESARSLGLKPWQIFWRVQLPLARPAIAAGMLLCLMETWADFGAVAYFGVQTFSAGIYRAWYAFNDKAAATVLACTLLFLIALIMAAEFKLRTRARYGGSVKKNAPTVRHQLKGAPAMCAMLGAALPVLLGFILPLIILCKLLLQYWGEHVLQRTAALFATTAGLGAVAACGILLLALLLVFIARFCAHPLSLSSRTASRLTYAVPGVVLAVGVLNFLGWLQNSLGWLLIGSSAALLLAYAVRFTGTAVQTLETGLHAIGRNLEHSAASLGVGKINMLARVHLPLLRKSLLTAWLVVFVEVVKELPATAILRPFGLNTLAVQAHHLAADEQLGLAALPALLIVLIALLPVLLLSADYTERKEK